MIPNYYIIGRDGKIAGCKDCGDTDAEKAIDGILSVQQ